MWWRISLWWHWRYYMILNRWFRWFYDWHVEYGHPYEMRWPGEAEDSHWGPRNPWICDIGDRLTGGWLHD